MSNNGKHGDLKMLRKGGSTSRVYDLIGIREKHRNDVDYRKAPIFHHPRLLETFIVKHSVRPWERQYINSERLTATKVIFPFSVEDLDLGGMSIFVESENFERQLSEFLGETGSKSALANDFKRLRALADLPSFDPYLLSERFRQEGDVVASCFFQASEDEIKRMTDFVASQVDVLVSLAFGGGDAGTSPQAKKLASILLSDETSENLRVLQRSLRLSDDEYRQGMFGWKGVLYYSWSSDEIYKTFLNFLSEVKELRIIGCRGDEQSYLDHTKEQIIISARNRWLRLRSVIDNYNTEFDDFAKNGNALALKNFLLSAPSLFLQIGEDLASVQHVASYWKYWMQGRSKPMKADDALVLLPDFAASLHAADEADALRERRSA